MPLVRGKKWWWAAAVPSVAVMLAASSSMYVHAYLPTTHHVAEEGEFNEAVAFNFDQKVDEFEYTNAATVTMTDFTEISEDDYARKVEETGRTWGSYEELKYYAVTIEWEADPMTPLNGCDVILHGSDNTSIPADPWFAQNDISWEEHLEDLTLSNIGSCEPRGYPGPMAYEAFDIGVDVLPGTSRPPRWTMDYYFAFPEDRAPDYLSIDWHTPHQVRLELPD